MNMFSLFMSDCLSIFLENLHRSISRTISLSLTPIPSVYLNICPLLFFLCFQFPTKRQLLKRGLFSFWGFVGPRLLIVCLQWPLYPAIKPEKKRL